MSEDYDARSERGFYGIGIFTPKFQSNVGVLWRSAFNFRANFIFTVGKRYQYRADVTQSHRHIPLYEYEDWAEFKRPSKSSLVGIEICGYSKPLPEFTHPERAIYLLGAEDSGIPQDILDQCDHVVEVPSHRCLNVSATGAVVMYDRIAKGMNSG